MISSRLKNIFALLIPVFIVHGLEEYFTGLYNVDSFYQSFSNPKAVFVIIVLILANTSLVVSYLLIRKNKWLLGLSFLLGILLIYELSHLYRAVMVGGYYPGLYTALLFPIIGYFYGIEFIRNYKKS